VIKIVLSLIEFNCIKFKSFLETTIGRDIDTE